MSRSRRVPYVDDDVQSLELVVARFERRVPDVTMGTASSPEEVLGDPRRLANVECPLTDYEMPGTNGIELLETVREEHPSLPVILYTARGSESVASEAISADVTDYIRKGGGEDHWDLLANRVRTAVDHYRATEKVDEVTRRRRRILGRITDRFIAVDSEWRITEANRQAVSGFPGSREDHLGDDFLELIRGEGSDDGNPFVPAYREAMETQEPKTVVGQSEADPDRLHQLLENLLRNAVEHAGPAVRVGVGTLADGRGFYVADDGPGIAEGDVESATG
uniref:ATP-binding response regulator n=1 Tax=Halorarum salinum TaxID=2743089 RepID=UPI001FE44455|nr:response regulator [Halobaculum salinum]